MEIPFKSFCILSILTEKNRRIFCIFFPIKEPFLCADHKCEEKGCGSIIVLDGNMKNSRQVCNVKDVTRYVCSSLHDETKTGKHQIYYFLSS